MRLTGKVALVIGASRGMGKQMALRVAEEGADVVVAARSEQAGQSSEPGTIVETAQQIERMGRGVLPLKVDLAIGTEVDEMCRKAIAAFGRIDILIHSVQYRGPGYHSLFADTTIEQLETQVAVNLMSAVRACKLVTPAMKTQGEGGRIILVTSEAGQLTSKGMTGLPGDRSTGLGYPMTKAAMIRFIASLEKEVRPDNIAIIGLDPGFTHSEHVEIGRSGDSYNGFPLSWAHPMDVPAEAARYLCICPNPMWYSGKNLVAADFVQEHCLWSAPSAA